MITRNDSEERVAVPGHLISDRAGEHFVLRVVGDAMKEQGICDGDFLVVLRRHCADPGELAIVQVGDDSLIRFWCPRQDGMVALESEDLGTLLFREDECKVIGIPVGLMRKFKPRRSEA